MSDKAKGCACMGITTIPDEGSCDDPSDAGPAVTEGTARLLFSDRGYGCLVMVAIVMTGLLLYAKTADFPFVFDDIHYIVDNPLIKDISYFSQLTDIRQFVQIDEKLGIDPDLTTNFILRPLSYLTFALNYRFHSLEPAGYRMFNVSVHILNSVLLYLLVSAVLRFSPKGKALQRGSLRLIPTVAALFFLIHPIQVQSVTYVVQRFTSLATFFYLATLYLYLRSFAHDGTGAFPGYRMLALLALVSGMMVKEIMFTAPIMLLIMEVIILGAPFVAALKRTLPFILCMGFTPILVAISSALQYRSDISLAGAQNIVNYSNYPPLFYAVTQLTVITRYLRMLIVPYGQNIDHDYPLFVSLFEPSVLLSLTVIAALIIAAALLFRSKPADIRYSLIFFGVLWYFLAISVSSGFIPLPDLMAEQRAYLPSAGIFFILAAGADLLRTAYRSAVCKYSMLIALFAWGALLCGLTYARNDAWGSRITIWSDSVEKSPLKARPWDALGMAYVDAADSGRAMKCFETAISLNNAFVPSYISLSAIYNDRKRYADARELCLKALELDPANFELLTYLGNAYAGLGQLNDAERAFNEALSINPAFEKALSALARVRALKQ